MSIVEKYFSARALCEQNDGNFAKANICTLFTWQASLPIFER